MYSNKKQFFTLLELVIAISLTVVILSTLTYFYRQVNVMNVEMDKAQNEAFKLLYVENRLANSIPKAEKAFNFYFFTSPDVGGLYKQGTTSLLFTFDNCVKLNKQMAYIVVGRLYLDNDGNFTLATWPAPKRWKENEPVPMKKEILMEGVDNLFFEFFGEVEGQENYVWVSEWKKEYKKLPIIVKINLIIGEEKFTYAFPLPNTAEPITYRL